MRFLLDTHSFLWFIDGELRLDEFAREIIADDDNDVFLSIASIWELAIKVSAGKLRLDQSLDRLLEREVGKFVVLAVDVKHALATVSLPYHHRDPFDRMLAAQSLVEELPLVSVDPIFDKYSVDRVWKSMRSD